MNNFTDIRCKSTGEKLNMTKWLITFERGKKEQRRTVTIMRHRFLCVRTVFFLGPSREPNRRVAAWGVWGRGGDGWCYEDESASAQPCYWFVIEARANRPGWHPDSWPEGRGRRWNRDGEAVDGSWTSEEKLRFIAVLFKKAWGEPVILFQLSCVLCSRDFGSYGHILVAAVKVCGW